LLTYRYSCAVGALYLFVNHFKHIDWFIFGGEGVVLLVKLDELFAL
jgi:hypothetical protein